jgi:hypothetical protein
MSAIEHIINDSMQIGVIRTLQLLGVSSGEISQRKAIETYGKWFKDQVEDGTIRPIRIEEGKHGAKIYSVTDILAVRVRQSAPAELR